MKLYDIIQFGKYNWRILDKQGDNMLIITEDIIEIRLYDLNFVAEVWETCTLREYLNVELLNKFTPDEQARIMKTKIPNLDNPWYGTLGGEDTYDKIFLLSIEEAYKYFGGIGDMPKYNTASDANGNLFSDSHNVDRQAKYRGNLGFWWLRSPGSQCVSGAFDFDDTDTGYAAFISDDGCIGVVGLDLYGFIDVGGVGVRPALWLNNKVTY